MFTALLRTAKTKVLIFLLLLHIAPTLSYQNIAPSVPTDNAALDTLYTSSPSGEIEENIPLSESQYLIADRLFCIEQTIPLTYNSRVHDFINYFTIKNRNYTRTMIGRINLYFPLFEKHLARYNLPDELKYLAIIESGLNPNAESRAGATGLWQFMPFTGQQFGLSNNWYVDERRDPEKSTQAACQYLIDLHDRFGDWELVLLAYNSGPGKVRSAIKKAGYRKRAKDIYRYLPAETRSYLSQFVAIAYSIKYHKAHELCIPIEKRPLAYDTLTVKGLLHLKTLANLTETSPEVLRKLNPTIVHQVVPRDSKSYILKVPRRTKKLLAINRMAILDSASKVIPEEVLAYEKAIRESMRERKQIFYTVRSGDMLLSIARRFRISPYDIQKWNDLQSPLIRIKQRLSLWVPTSSKSSKGQKNPDKKATPTKAL